VQWVGRYGVGGQPQFVLRMGHLQRVLQGCGTAGGLAQFVLRTGHPPISWRVSGETRLTLIVSYLQCLIGYALHMFGGD
jgi:hypothetical protein